MINAPNGSIEGDFVFSIIDGENTLSQYLGNETSIVLPQNYKGENYAIGNSVFKDCTSLTSVTIPNCVTSIGNSAFQYCSSLASIEIPNSVTTIGEDAFSNCSSLKSITIPNSVTSIGSSAFYYCTSLTSVTISNSVTTIGDWAFYNCYRLTSVTIPNSVTTIGSYAFYDCRSLTSVTIPNSVTTIGEDAFKYCYRLTSVTIPNSVTSIGSSAFSGCSSLESIKVDSGNTIYNSRNNCNAIIETTTNTLIAGCKNTVIPNSVTSIGSSAFSGCSSLKSITIPNSVTSIGSSAFSGCSSLKSVTIPNCVTSIGNSAFQYCSSLASIEIPNSVTTIGEDAFKYCSNLKTVINHSNLTLTKGSSDYGYVAYYADKVIDAPNSSTEGDFVFTIIDGVNTLCEYLGNDISIVLPSNYKGESYVIGEDAFRNCTSLTNVTIPNSVTTIGDGAFYGCSGLTSVTIGNSVTTIGDGAFSGCSLKEVHITDIAAWCNIDYEYNSSNPLYYAKNLYLNGELVTNLVIPDSVTEIKQYAFCYCSSLTSVTIPNSVTTIGYYAFRDCTSLTSITIPNSVTTIGNYAFSSCDNLTSVTIPNSVTTIGDYAFYSCDNLTSVTIPNSVTTIRYEAFDYCSSLKEVHITDLVAWCNIDFSDYDSNPLYYAKNLYLNGELVTNLVIPDWVTEIKKYAFYYCRSLESVTIPNSVTTIGNYAFYSCSNLKEIYCKAETPATIDYYYTFYNCYSATLYVPRGTKDAYQSAEYWSNFANIVEMDFAITGDINGDDKVNVGDVTSIVSMILDPSAATDAADINGDGKVNVDDITNLVSIILGTSNNAPARAAATSESDTPVVSASFDEDGTMLINVSNPDYPFTAIQFDLTIEGGIGIVNDGEYYDVFLGSRTSSRNHSEPECAVKPDGSLRVVILSLKNKLFEGTEGDVATVSLDLTGIADGSYSYSIKNIVLSDPQSVMEYPADIEAWVNVAGGVTGINNIAADGENANEAIYDLCGRKVKNPVKGGIYIKGGKKIIM